MGAALRKVHFAVTVLVGLPLVVWTVTGFAFTCFDFAEVRGTRDRAPAEDVGEAGLDATNAVKRARALRGADARVVEVTIRALLGRPTYVIQLAEPYEPVIVDGLSGEAREGISLDDAKAIARRAYRGDVRVLDAEPVPAGGAPSIGEPAYRVSLDDSRHTEVFVAARTGEILSWRNDAWRRFDRLWSLHVFGFVDRSSPAHWPLRVAGGFAAVAALSGSGLLLGGLRRRASRGLAARGEA
jgi:hypothetical protein